MNLLNFCHIVYGITSTLHYKDYSQCLVSFWSKCHRKKWYDYTTINNDVIVWGGHEKTRSLQGIDIYILWVIFHTNTDVSLCTTCWGIISDQWTSLTTNVPHLPWKINDVRKFLQIVTAVSTTLQVLMKCKYSKAFHWKSVNTKRFYASEFCLLLLTMRVLNKIN